MPDPKIPDINFAELNQALRDSAYAAVGLGVLGLQRAQVRRHELTEQLRAQYGSVESQINVVGKLVEDRIGPAIDQLGHLGTRHQVMDFAKALDHRMKPAREQLDRRLNDLEDRLPEQARAAAHNVHSAVKAQEAALRSVIGLD